jgi:hypothetical protein
MVKYRLISLGVTLCRTSRAPLGRASAVS